MQLFDVVEKQATCCSERIHIWEQDLSFVLCELIHGDFDEAYLRNQTIQKPGAYTATIPKTNHGSYTDLAGVSPIINEAGADVAANFQLINELSLSFFDQHLKGITDHTLDAFGLRILKLT